MPRDRLNIDRIVWILLDSLAQVFDVYAYQIGATGIVGIIPHVF